MLEQVADQFRGKPFVGSIQVIPTLYLQSRGGFANLDQLRNLYQIDVMVLVSYDQVQFSDGTPFSLTYWTLVGAYVVPAERNATHTLLDAAVFDLPSRQMLFRAPGISRIKGLSTLVGVERSLREDSLQSFRQASTNLISGLNTELAHFQDQMKSRPETAQIVHRKGYTGGGALRWSDLAFAFGVVATGWAIRGRRP